MSDEKSQQQEPTMEEILASIRRIISENEDGDGKPTEAGPKAPAAAGPVSAPPAGTNDAEDEILELTEVVEEAPLEDADEDSDEAAGDDVVMEDIPAQGPESPASMKEPTFELPQADSADRPRPQPAESLVSDATAAASTAALSQLARALDRDPRGIGNIALGAGNTLEDLVKDMIRPMLKEWLDQNLAPLVERLVRREIERMVRRAEDEV